MLRKEYLSKIDLDLLQEFSKRYQQEQEAKRTKVYKDVVDANFNRIKELIEAGTFPGEKRIGIDNAKLSASISDCNVGNSKVIVTLLHYDYPMMDIRTESLMEAIKNGHLHPREWATIYTFEKNKVSILYEKSNKEYKRRFDYHFNFPFGDKLDDLEKVNKARWTFGICKYEVDLKKEEISRKYGMRLKFNY